jgi:hypothetical protein
LSKLNEVFERIYIKEALSKIGIKDRRSFYRWCSLNRVSLFRDDGCKKIYVDKDEFQNAIEKRKIAKKITTVEFSSRMSFFAELKSSLESNKNDVKSSQEYKPKFESDIEFLSSLTIKS